MAGSIRQLLCTLYGERCRDNSYPLDRIFNNDLPRGKFQRIHRSYAINVFKVTGFAGNYVHIGKKMLPVSESHKKNFLACFHKIYSKRALGK